MEKVVVFQLLSRVWLFTNPWFAARQAPLSFIISWSLLRFMSIESVMISNHLILCCPYSFCLQSFPASRSFPVSQLFGSGGQSKVEREHDTIFLFFTWLPISCFYPGRCFCKLSPVYTFSKAKEKGCILFLHSFWFFILHWQKEMENVVVQSKWRIPLVSG